MEAAWEVAVRAVAATVEVPAAERAVGKGEREEDSTQTVGDWFETSSFRRL